MDPDQSLSAETDVEKLREALATERRSRAWLESRLEELDQRLRRSQAAERALQNAGAQDQIAVLGLHATLTADAAKESDREELDLWLQVAALHADAAPASPTPAPTRMEPIVVVREPALDTRYEEKLSSARAAMETAEARASHQAAQLRRLTDELAASRAEQMRALNRIKELEKKLLRIEAQADLLDSAIAERVVDKGAPEFDLPAETMAPLTPVKPSLVYTDTEEGTLLAPAEPEPADETPGLSLEDFEPRAHAHDARPQVTESDSGNLEDALSELFGEAPAEKTAVKATAPSDESSMDAIADALEIWGGGPAVTFESPAPPAPVEAPARESYDDADPFAGLASALESLNTAPIAAPDAPKTAAAAVDDAPFGGLAAAMEEFGANEAAIEEVSAADAAVEEIAEEPAPEAPAQTATIEIEAEPLAAQDTVVLERPRDLYDALEQVTEERTTTRRGRKSPSPTPERATERTAAMAESLSTWSGEPADNGDEKAVPPKGRAAMVDALLRFMGPQ